jgi:hypothetical protein
MSPQEKGAIERVRSSRAYVQLGDAAALAAPELTLVPRLLRIGGRRLILVIGGSLAFAAIIAVAIVVWNSANEKMARQATTRFGAALVHDDPASAPPGAAEYVRGVRAYFGPVTAARLIGSHQRAVGQGEESQTFYVAEVLLTTRRGLAVVEVEFDNGSINSDRVSSVYELAPRDARGLSGAQRKALTAAFAARGNTPADEMTFDRAASNEPMQTATRAPAAPTAPSRTVTIHARPSTHPISGAAARQLRCVRAAHHDVGKLAKCVR